MSEGNIDRVIATNHEIEVLDGDTDSNAYRYQVRNTVRQRIERLEWEMLALEAAAPELADEARDAVGAHDADTITAIRARLDSIEAQLDKNGDHNGGDN